MMAAHLTDSFEFAKATTERKLERRFLGGLDEAAEADSETDVRRFMEKAISEALLRLVRLLAGGEAQVLFLLEFHVQEARRQDGQELRG